MPEKPLLLSSARSGVIVSTSSFGGNPLLRGIAVLAGIVVVVIGAWDASLRLTAIFPNEVGVTAFAPAIVALDPGVLSATGSSLSTTSVFIPARLSVPSIGVEASVEQVGVKADGSMANPSSFRTAGWYKLGARAGEAGNVVLAGHVNNGIGLSGVFARLAELPIGERVVLRGGSGEEILYVVVSKTQYVTASAPLAEIFKIEGPSQLILITCEGDWDPESRSYDRRLVVVARPVLKW